MSETSNGQRGADSVQRLVRRIALAIAFRVIHHYQAHLDEKGKRVDFWSNLHTEIFKEGCEAFDRGDMATHERCRKQMAVIGKRLKEEIHDRYA